MKELVFLDVINKVLSKKASIGDDCAYLKDFGIVVTQDNLVEDIHFCQKFSTPYQVAYKSVMVNLSDIFAAGAQPKYLTIGLSLPNSVTSAYVEEFYSAIEDASQEFGFEVVGGDITGADKIFVSICAIGSSEGRTISSRSSARIGDCVIVTGEHGSSAAGLELLQQNLSSGFENFVSAHLKPTPQADFSKEIAEKTTREYAMMDTSDGLADALFKIAKASGVKISVDFAKIPYDKKIESTAGLFGKNFQDWILYGGEDFQLVACVDKDVLSRISAPYSVIGSVESADSKGFVEINFGDRIEKIADLEKTFNHFRKGEDEH